LPRQSATAAISMSILQIGRPVNRCRFGCCAGSAQGLARKHPGGGGCNGGTAGVEQQPPDVPRDCGHRAPRCVTRTCMPAGCGCKAGGQQAWQSSSASLVACGRFEPAASCQTRPQERIWRRSQVARERIGEANTAPLLPGCSLGTDHPFNLPRPMR
jgi:hypothetical protein